MYFVLRESVLSPDPTRRDAVRKDSGGERGNGQYSVTARGGGVEEATPRARATSDRTAQQIHRISLTRLFNLYSSQQIGCGDRSFARQRNDQAPGLIIPSNLEGLDRVVENGAGPARPPRRAPVPETASGLLGWKPLVL